MDSINSLSAKSVLEGEKLVAMYSISTQEQYKIFYAKRKLGTTKSTYQHNAQISEYRTIFTSAKKIQFRPSIHVIIEGSFVKIPNNSWQAEVIVRSMHYRTP